MRSAAVIGIATAIVLSGSAVAVADTVPLTPVDLLATNTATTITLTWRQPTTGIRPVSFRVYEGTTIVDRNTTTRATIRNLQFGSSHTYAITAVDRYGRESARSAPVTRQAFQGGPFGCGITAPSGLTATEVTASSVSLRWSNTVPYWDQSATLVVYVDGAPQVTTTLDGARIGGLASASTHTLQVARRDCSGGLHFGPSLAVTTASGAAARPTAPTALTVGARTNTSIGLSWTAPPGTAFAVYDGGTRVATTTGTATTVRGLWRDTTHQFTVTAVDAAGNESATSTPVTTTTLPCDPAQPAPSEFTAAATVPSSVALSWASTVEATSYTVYANGTPVATLPTPSARITGLPSATTTRFTVTAQTTCGATPPSGAVSATTPAGPPDRPSPVTDLRASAGPASYDNTAPVTLSWTAPASADPIVEYRIYEGAEILAMSTTPGLTTRLPSGPTHTVTIVAVDRAGNESTQSAPVTFTVPYIPVP